MAYQTSNSITTTKSEIYNKADDGLGPIEWEFSVPTGGDTVRLYFTGAFPESGVAVSVAAGETYRYASYSRGITKIEADVATTTTTLTMRPSIT